MLAICLTMLETEQDQRRFIELYNAYEKKVCLTALRFLGNPTQAEDAAQQTWVRLLRSWERVCALSWSQTGGYVATVA